MSSPMFHIAPQTVAWEPNRGLVAVRQQADAVTGVRADAAHESIAAPSMPIAPAVRAHSAQAQASSGDGTAIVRQRFYPAQLRRMASAELQSLAASRKQRITWSGWDRSLPRLYLPVESLTRLMIEAVDGITRAVEPTGIATPSLNIRIDASRPGDSMLVLSLECDQWNCDPKFRGALNARWFRQGSQAHLWQRLARRADVVGGWLSVVSLPGGGAGLSMHLPIDQPRALVYSWLSRQAAALATAERSSRAGIDSYLPLSLYAIGRAAAETIDELRAANVRLQSLARPEDYIYRVAHGRWIWLTTHTELPSFVSNAAWQSQLLDRWHCLASHPAILDMAQQLDRRFRQLIGTRVPPLDLRTQPVSRGPVTSKRPNTRVDQPNKPAQASHLQQRTPSRQTKWRYPI